MIALLCPTRDRRPQFERMVESIYKTCSNPNNVQIYSGTNGDDYTTGKIYPTDCPTVYMWNDLAQIAIKGEEHKLFMLCADDIIFSTQNWDKALIDHYNELENKIHVYHLQDSRDPEGTPHPIMTREWIFHMGWLVPPIFMHWYTDSWSSSMAKANNCFTHLKDYLLIHEKPSDHGETDETHNRIRRNGWQARDKIVHETCQHLLQFETARLGIKLGNKAEYKVEA